MTSNSPRLRFTRSLGGAYIAQDATRQYRIAREDRRWSFEVRTLTTTAGVRHALGQPLTRKDSYETKALAVAVAQGMADGASFLDAHCAAYHNEAR